MKIDDGMPLTGRVITFGYYDNAGQVQDFYPSGVAGVGASPIAQTPGSSTTCFDNNNSTLNPMAYSLGQNNGAGVNCLLSIRMQAGD